MPKIGPVEIDIQLRIGEVTVMRVRPGDKIIFSHPQRLSMPDIHHIREMLADQLDLDPAINPVIVLDAGATLEIARQLGDALGSSLTPEDSEGT